MHALIYRMIAENTINYSKYENVARNLMHFDQDFFYMIANHIIVGWYCVCIFFFHLSICCVHVVCLLGFIITYKSWFNGKMERTDMRISKTIDESKPRSVQSGIIFANISHAFQNRHINYMHNRNKTKKKEDWRSHSALNVRLKWIW